MADGSRYLDFGRELVVDLFAGGGGASHGISRAYREPDVAVNHNPIAIAVHTINHPHTKHYVEDVFDVDPLNATKGQPRDRKIRGLAWVVTKWAAAVKPRLICLENVEEFTTWGPLTNEGKPCPERKGETFNEWKSQLQALGYEVEHRELVAADYGAPTIRKRLYVIARCDGRPIVWPEPTHSKHGDLTRWVGADTCIDWTIPAQSIFERKKDLSRNTMNRIAKGMWRYVLNTESPYIVGAGVHSMVILRKNSGGAPITDPANTISTSGGHHGLMTACLTEHANASTQRVFDVSEPLRTQCAQVKGGHFALVTGHMMQIGYGDPEGRRVQDVRQTLPTVVASNKHALVAAHVTHLTHHGNRSGNDITESLRTVTAANRGEQALISAFLEQANGGFYEGDGRSVEQPMSTITQAGSNQRLVSACMVKYYGNDKDGVGITEPMHTVTTKDRIGLVEIQLVADVADNAKRVSDFLHEYLPDRIPQCEAILLGGYVITDITLRMLAPRELARAQGFPDSYEIEQGIDADGKQIKTTRSAQVALIGNSVCPDVAEAIIRANLADLIALYAKVAA